MDFTLYIFFPEIHTKNSHQTKKERFHISVKPLVSLVRLEGFEPSHPVPETGALSPEL